MIVQRSGLLMTTLVVTGMIWGAACGRSEPPPAVLDTAHEPCRFCRMVISDQRFASQIVAPYEEPRFFDDLGCLGNFLKRTRQLPSGALVYVADHRTRAWVRADRAVYTRVDTLSGPMGSHVIAHQSSASRDADVDAAKGFPASISEVFPSGLPKGGSR